MTEEKIREFIESLTKSQAHVISKTPLSEIKENLEFLAGFPKREREIFYKMTRGDRLTDDETEIIYENPDLQRLNQIGTLVHNLAASLANQQLSFLVENIEEIRESYITSPVSNGSKHTTRQQRGSGKVRQEPKEERLQAVYILHGISGNSEIFLSNGSTLKANAIEMILDKYPFEMLKSCPEPNDRGSQTIYMKNNINVVIARPRSDVCKAVVTYNSGDAESVNKVINQLKSVGIGKKWVFDKYVPTLAHLDKVVEDVEEIVKTAKEERSDREKDIIREVKLEPLDSSLTPSASQERIFEFYSGESPSPARPSAWGIITAKNGAVARDQEEEIEQALQEEDNFHIICIVAEPGAGKTTLAMRVLYKLSQREEHVFWLKDCTVFNRQFWDQLSELAELINSHIYIFIDDLFRDRVFVKALQDMYKGCLPVTIIATSRTNEYEDRKLKEFIRKVELNLSEKEKKDLLERVGKSYEDLSLDERKVFNETNLFLVLGMVLSKGKGFSEIIEDIVDGLKEKDEALYRAYEYVCFSSNYDISIPEDLLINLDEQGRFYRLLENKAAKGIFYEDSIPSYPTRFIKAGHQLIAKEALRYYSRYPKVLFEETLDAADEENWMHRQYIAYLTRAILEGRQEISKEDVKDTITKSEKITHILQYASISELNVWQSIYRQLNLQEEAEKCAEAILLRPPTTTLDCQLLISELLNRGLADRAFSTIREWLEEHQEDRRIFTRYLPLVKEKGSQEQIEEVIGETSLWLKEHSEDNTVRKAWLTLIRDKGTREQIEKVIEETRLWLKKHPEDHHVRVSYVPLVKEKGSQEQIEGVIEETNLWLKEHPEDYTVRASYVPLVKEKGSQEQIEGVIEETSLWLKEHPEDYTVRASYVPLVKEKGSQEQIEGVIEETDLWLKEHPEDSMIRSSYFSLVKEKGNEEQIEEVIDETTRWWLQNHPDDNVFHEAWLVLIRDKGNQEQIRKGMKDTISWLKDHPEDNKIRSVYLSLVRNKGFFKEEDIKQALADTEQWMKKHGPHPLFQDYLPLVEKVIKTEIDVDIDIELVKQFGYEFINSSKWEYNIRPIRDFADWLGSEKFFDEAEQIYERLLKTKMRNLERSTIYFSHGKMFLGQAMNLEFSNEERMEKRKRAEEKFRKVLEVRSKHHMAHAFLAITLKELGENYEAKYEFNDAEWRAPFDEKRKMLFIGSIPQKLELKNILDGCIIPDEIKDIFEAEGKTLSENTLVIKKEKIKNRWIIKDNESYYLIIEEKEKRGSNFVRFLNIYGDYHPGRLPYKIGNFYLEFNRYKEAIRWLKMAIREEPEDFTNWWKSGHAKRELALNIEERGFHKEANELFSEALSELEMALEKAPKPLQLPASKDIPDQITECKKHL